LGSYVPGSKVKLDDVSKILGLSGKPDGVDGSRVEEMVLAGQIEEVAHYCESDVLNTYRVWLVYELFRDGDRCGRRHDAGCGTRHNAIAAGGFTEYPRLTAPILFGLSLHCGRHGTETNSLR